MDKLKLSKSKIIKKFEQKYGDTFTQKKIAKSLGITEVTLSNYFSNNFDYLKPSIRKILTELDLDILDILEEKKSLKTRNRLKRVVFYVKDKSYANLINKFLIKKYNVTLIIEENFDIKINWGIEKNTRNLRIITKKELDKIKNFKKKKETLFYIVELGCIELNKPNNNFLFLKDLLKEMVIEFTIILNHPFLPVTNNLNPRTRKIDSVKKLYEYMNFEFEMIAISETNSLRSEILIFLLYTLDGIISPEFIKRKGRELIMSMKEKDFETWLEDFEKDVLKELYKS